MGQRETREKEPSGRDQHISEETGGNKTNVQISKVSYVYLKNLDAFI